MSALEHNPPTIPPICNQPKVYFAYGSNLHLRQMANRCPESKLLGIGRLWGHRWQINERGYANVVEHIASHVDGICYLLNETDEARLDINEGVGVGAYEKQVLELEVLRRPATLVGRDVVQIVNDGCLYQERSTADGSDYSLPRRSLKLSSSTQDSSSDFSKGGEFVEALVYVSTRFTKDHYPREEYIGRMNSGLNDANLMGVSSDYVDSIIKQYLTPGVTKYLE